MTKREIEYKKFSNVMDKQMSVIYNQILPLIDTLEERFNDEENITDDDSHPWIYKTLFDVLLGQLGGSFTVDELCGELKDSFAFYFGVDLV